MATQPVAPTKPALPAHIRRAGLRYATDGQPGIKRVGSPKAFQYLGRNNRPLKGDRFLSRIQKLVIPPAWTDVWICADPRGHIQAIGRDARGRKQYIYHPRWRELRDENKFDRLLEFGRALPKIRREISRQMRQPELSREKVLAALIRLLELSAIRVGNEEYAVQNKSYGLTTLRNRHASVNGSTIRLRFTGKSGKEHDITLEHPTLARIIRKCQNLPGQNLFQYVVEDGVRQVTSDDVNDYLVQISGQEFTAKDFRTWAATVRAMLVLGKAPSARSPRARQKSVVEMIKEVARHLGNTPAICRKSYIHPGVMECYLNGTLVVAQCQPSKARIGLRPEEKAVISFLKGLKNRRK